MAITGCYAQIMTERVQSAIACGCPQDRPIYLIARSESPILSQAHAQHG